MQTERASQRSFRGQGVNLSIRSASPVAGEMIGVTAMAVTAGDIDWIYLNLAGSDEVRVGELISAEAGGLPIYRGSPCATAAPG